MVECENESSTLLKIEQNCSKLSKIDFLTVKLFIVLSAAVVNRKTHINF